MNSRQRFPLTERQTDEIIAYRASGPVSVGRLVAEAYALSKRLPNHPFVINLHGDRYRYLLSFCAAIVAGQCTLMPPNRQPTTLAQLAEMYADCYSTGGDNGDPGDGLIVATDDDVSIPHIPADQLCAIAFTSGSTGAPQPNLKYWQTFRTGSLSNKRLLLGESSKALNLVATVPAQHMWGLETSILLPLFANAAVSHLTPFFPKDIADTLDAIPEPRALVSSPIHLETLLKSGVQTKQIAAIYSATAPLSKELAMELEDCFNTQVIDIFGCSESGILAVRRTSTESLWNVADVFELNATADGIEIRADHLPENVLMPDIVELSGNHQFRWIGRRQDMINIAGKRGSLADLNHRLREIPGVADGVIFIPEGRDNRLAALVVAPNLQVSDILKQLKSQVDPVFLPRPVYPVSALPRQETGKLAIKAVRELFEETRKST